MSGVQGCLAHKKTPPARTLRQETWGPVEVLGGARFLMSEVPLYAMLCGQAGGCTSVQGYLAHKKMPTPLGPL